MLASAGKTKVGLLLIILSLVVVVLGLTWLAVSWENGKHATTAVEIPAGNTVTPTATAVPTATARTQRTTLTDPSGQNVLGELVKESVSADDSRFRVTVKLPAPAGADFYAVWLTQAEGTDKKLLGKLNPSGADYVLEYQSSEEMQNFDKIVVTGGSSADTKIETVVAEGTVASQLLL